MEQGIAAGKRSLPLWRLSKCEPGVVGRSPMDIFAWMQASSRVESTTQTVFDFSSVSCVTYFVNATGLDLHGCLSIRLDTAHEAMSVARITRLDTVYLRGQPKNMSSFIALGSRQQFRFCRRIQSCLLSIIMILHIHHGVLNAFGGVVFYLAPAHQGHENHWLTRSRKFSGFGFSGTYSDS